MAPTLTPTLASFIHIDCDLYSSTKTVLTLLAPAIRTGTVLVFDEWCGYEGWEQHEARCPYPITITPTLTLSLTLTLTLIANLAQT